MSAFRKCLATFFVVCLFVLAFSSIGLAAPKEEFEDHIWKDLLTPDMIKIYEPYARETYVGENAAVLVIDLYNSAYAGGSVPIIDLQDTYPSSMGEVAWNAIKPTVAVLEAARKKGLPVFYSANESRPETLLTAPTKRRSRDQSTEAYQIKTEFAPQEGDILVTKQRASAFYGTPLVALLRLRGVDSLIIVGESTSGCVRASVLDAYNYGFHVSVVEESCFDRSMLVHKMNLFDIHHKYADVMHVEEVLKHLNSLPAPEKR